MNKLWNAIKWIGAGLIGILFLVLGKRVIDYAAAAEKLEKEVDEQKKKVVQQKIEVANLEYDLEVAANDRMKEEEINAIKIDIQEKKKVLKTDVKKLNAYTAELDKAKVKAKGSIRKVK